MDKCSICGKESKIDYLFFTDISTGKYTCWNCSNKIHPLKSAYKKNGVKENSEHIDDHKGNSDYENTSN